MDKDLLRKALEIQKNDNIGIMKNEKDYAFTFIYPPSKLLYNLDENVFNSKKVQEANLYIHIPYCTGRCTYCYFGCYMLNVAPIERTQYVQKICKEIQGINARYGKIQVLSVHFGGGTPTTLSEADINTIFKELNKNFEMGNEIEITFESSPETLTEKKIECLVSNGVNRINIGIQTLNDNLLKDINRRHDSKKALESIRLVQNAGISNINVDLMYGLHGQTMEDWISTLNIVFQYGLQSISTYRLRIHPNGKIRDQINTFNEESAIKMYVKMMELMEKNEYFQCSSHKFAIKEELAQKQIINKRGVGKSTLIPIGMAAYGYIDNILYWNERRMENYIEKIEKEQLPYSVGYVLDKAEEMAKICVLGIHNVNGIDLVKFEDKFGVEVFEVYGELIDRLQKYGVLEIENNYMRPSKLGMVFADEIATEFYSQKVKEKLGKNKYGIFFDQILD